VIDKVKGCAGASRWLMALDYNTKCLIPELGSAELLAPTSGRGRESGIGCRDLLTRLVVRFAGCGDGMAGAGSLGTRTGRGFCSGLPTPFVTTDFQQRTNTNFMNYHYLIIIPLQNEPRSWLPFIRNNYRSELMDLHTLLVVHPGLVSVLATSKSDFCGW